MKTKRFKARTAIFFAVLAALVLCPLTVKIVAEELPDTANSARAFFIGARNVEGVTVGSYGVGLEVHDNVWLFNINDYGLYSSVGVEVALLFQSGRFAFGPIAGFNADQVPVATEADPITYLLGASGGLFTVRVMGKIGGWTYYKYKVQLGVQDEYKVDHNFGAGIFILFGS